MKPCKTPQCDKKRFGSSSWCRTHYYARLREKKARRLERKLKSKGYEARDRRILRNKLDAAFSKLVRSRGRCERCGKRENLQCSHVYSRANLAVRWDEDNATCFCAGCHIAWWHKQPLEASEWLLGYYGPEKVAALRIRANTARHWTVNELRRLLEEINAKIVTL